jgi:hypothetical protein
MNTSISSYNSKAKLNFKPSSSIKFLCSYCKKHVDEKDFVTSFRLQPDNFYLVVTSCRACRDSGI